mmetsp:Transcript_7622/g.19673  ORF Transcript_7622/g.19673 Transcript_7622/m.19673 type:complete len:221 (+) Transcript_7622:568-1230(+)
MGYSRSARDTAFMMNGRYDSLTPRASAIALSSARVVTSPDMSISSEYPKTGTDAAATIVLTIVRCRPLMGTTLSSPSGTARVTGVGAAAGGGAAEVAAAVGGGGGGGGGVAAVAASFSRNRNTSSLSTRLFLPVGVTRLRSRLCSLTMRRTAGVIRSLWAPPPALVAPSPLGASAAVGSGGAVVSAGASFRCSTSSGISVSSFTSMSHSAEPVAAMSPSS